jgi:hypothetical protein
MLFFRTQGDEANVDGIDDQLCIAADRLVSIQPATDTRIQMMFHSVKNNILMNNEQLSYDYVTLTVKEGDIQEALDGIIQTINGHPNSNGFIVIADDCVTTDSAVVALDDQAISKVYCHPSITGVHAISVAAKSYASQLPSMTSGGATTVISNALELAVNTNYHSIAGNCAMTIPSAAAGKAGDWITVRYITVITNGNTHSYTTTTDATFTAGSCVTRVGGGVASGVDVSDGSAKNVLTIDGDTDGDGGIGTVVKFVNQTGTTDGWAVEALVLNQGDGSAAMAGATAFS